MLTVETFSRAKCPRENRPTWKHFLHRFCLRRKISKNGLTWKRFFLVVATWKRFRSPFPKNLSFWVLRTGQGGTLRRGNVSKTFPRRACRPQIVATWKRFQKRFHVGRKRPTWKRFAKWWEKVLDVETFWAKKGPAAVDGFGLRGLIESNATFWRFTARYGRLFRGG